MKILQINTTVNQGSTGRIAEQIGQTVLQNGQDSYIAYARQGQPTKSIPIKIGTKKDVYQHVLISRFFDNHGFGSKTATIRFIEEIKIINPDIIHLHNVHGYYLHIGELFNYFKKINTPIVWTFHDCWPFTGHCAHFEDINCLKWITACYSCPKVSSYPKSLFRDNSKSNYVNKSLLFTAIKNSTIITPSSWLHNLVKQSFLKSSNVFTINNGIDLNMFRPTYSDTLFEKFKIDSQNNIILGVANIWAKHRGLDDFIKLGNELEKNYTIILIGMSKKQIAGLPQNIIGIERTESIEQLVKLYSFADIYLNLTYADTFPTTNIEALACGTPVITYDTGGSPETINENTGIIVEKGDFPGLKRAVESIIGDKVKYSVGNCRKRATEKFNKEDRFNDYLNLYQNILSNDN